MVSLIRPMSQNTQFFLTASLTAFLSLLIFTKCLFRNLDKQRTFAVTNWVLLFVRIFSEVASRTLIIGCFIYVRNNGTFGPHDAVGIYYGTIVFMFGLNIIFNQVLQSA